MPEMQKIVDEKRRRGDSGWGFSLVVLEYQIPAISGWMPDSYYGPFVSEQERLDWIDDNPCEPGERYSHKFMIY